MPFVSALRGISFLTRYVMVTLACFSSSVFAQDTLRIISTDRGMTQNLIALGFEEHLVGVDMSSIKLFDEHAPNAPKSVGYHRNLSAEGLLSLKPTLIIGSEFMGPQNAIGILQQLEIDVLRFPTPATTRALAQNITSISDSLNQQLQLQPSLRTKKLSNDALARSRSTIQKDIDQITNYLRNNQSDAQTGIFMLAASSRHGGVAGQETAGSAFLSLLNLENSAQFKGYQQVSMESLLALDPDLIVLAESAESGEENRAPNLVFTRAARLNRVFTIDASNLVSGLSLAALKDAERIQSALIHSEQ